MNTALQMFCKNNEKRGILFYANRKNIKKRANVNIALYLRRFYPIEAISYSPLDGFAYALETKLHNSNILFFVEKDKEIKHLDLARDVVDM